MQSEQQPDNGVSLIGRSEIDAILVSDLKDFCDKGETTPALLASDLIDNDYITDRGIAVGKAAGIVFRQLSMIRLGVPITAYTKRTKKDEPARVVLREGSLLLVTFGGRDRKMYGTPYWEVYVSEQFDILRVYQNSKHEFQKHDWPMGRDLPTHYLVKE